MAATGTILMVAPRPERCGRDGVPARRGRTSGFRATKAVMSVRVGSGLDQQCVSTSYSGHPQDSQQESPPRPSNESLSVRGGSLAAYKSCSGLTT